MIHNECVENGWHVSMHIINIVKQKDQAGVLLYFWFVNQHYEKTKSEDVSVGLKSRH